MKTLSIRNPTVTDRSVQFERLRTYLQNQVDLEGLTEEVEILSMCDNKEMTIGEKRTKLYQMASGQYSWQIDDDDEIASDALRTIFKVIGENKDCITFEERC